MKDDLDQAVAVAILDELTAKTGLTLTGLAKKAQPKLAPSTLTRFRKEPNRVKWRLSLPTINALLTAHGRVPSADKLLAGIDLAKFAPVEIALVDGPDEVINESEKRQLLSLWGQLEKPDRSFLMRAIRGSLIEAIKADEADDIATHTGSMG